jgi:hypothetical protein
MESKLYSITIKISSIIAFALIITVGTIPSIFEHVLAQEDVITSEDLGNDTLIDKDKGTTRSSTEFSAVNDTISGQNTSQWTIQH